MAPGHTFFILIGIIFACLYVLYNAEMRGLWASEYFVGVGPDVDVADFNTALPLQDFLTPAAPAHLSGLTAAGCAGADAARQLELGGQYVQRTNNYQRDYPDTCSAPLTELVGAVYAPRAIGAVVPCDGLC